MGGRKCGMVRKPKDGVQQGDMWGREGGVMKGYDVGCLKQTSSAAGRLVTIHS